MIQYTRKLRFVTADLGKIWAQSKTPKKEIDVVDKVLRNATLPGTHTKNILKRTHQHTHTHTHAFTHKQTHDHSITHAHTHMCTHTHVHVHVYDAIQ